MKKRLNHLILAGVLLATAGWSGQPAALAQTIDWTGGSADLTFYYDSNATEWHVVFRNKAATSATGLTDQFTGFPGIVGLNAGDFNFDTLNIHIGTTTTHTIGGTEYFLSPASGSSIFGPSDPGGGAPDFGLRTRLREDFGSGNVYQFDDFVFTLDLASSSLPGDFVLFNTDGFGNVDLLRYDSTETNPNLDATWDIWGHTHWNLGFSEYGDYTLVFDFYGSGGPYGFDASPLGQTTLNFSVIPEPGVFTLVTIAVLGALGLRRFRPAARGLT